MTKMIVDEGLTIDPELCRRLATRRLGEQRRERAGRRRRGRPAEAA